MSKDVDKKYGIFRVKAIKGTNTAKIKYCGLFNDDDNNKIVDEPLICNGTEGRNGMIGNINDSDGNEYIYKINDTIYMRFYYCNIRDSFLLSSRRLPIIYATIMYHTPIITGILFNIFLEFEITTMVKTEKQLINMTLDGKYQLRIILNDKESRVIELDSFTSNKDMIETIKTLIDTDEMKFIITKLLEDRRKERCERLGLIDNTYSIPKAKYNFNQLVKEYEEKN